jgi:putative hydrolase of the HAD superfamily
MKPHPGIFEYALQTTNASPRESIMIGDAIDIDILGAINAGWDTVYYNPRKLPHNRRPTFEITHLEELMRIF